MVMRIAMAALALTVGMSVYISLPVGAQEKAEAQVKGGLGERMQESIHDLNLTDDQETKIAEIRQEFQPRVKAAKMKLGALVKDEMEKVRVVLTPEQKTQLKALKDERKERRIEGLAARIAHLKELDLTDAEFAKFEEIQKEYRPKIEAALRNLNGLLNADQRKARAEGVKAGKKRREVLASLNLTGDQKAKVETVCQQIGGLVRQELQKIRDVLTEDQKVKAVAFKDERRDQIRDRMAARIMNAKNLNLTADQKTQLTTIRQEFHPRIHEAGNDLRAVIREEVQAIVAVLMK
jgi:Spy/CpxP family protein refolding chaperone